MGELGQPLSFFRELLNQHQQEVRNVAGKKKAVKKKAAKKTTGKKKSSKPSAKRKPATKLATPPGAANIEDQEYDDSVSEFDEEEDIGTF